MTTIEAIELFKKVRLRFGDERHIEAASQLTRLTRDQIERIESAVRERTRQPDLPLTEEPNADRAS